MRLLLIISICLAGQYALSFGAWDQRSDFGGEARHRTVMLAIGNRIYTGLGHYNGGGTNILFDDWWEYDPASGAWTQKADYAGGINYHATGFTINDIAYVGTGRISPGGNALVKDFFKYQAASNSWTQITDYPGVGCRGAVSFVVGNYGYVGTGETNSGKSSEFYRFDPVSETWLQIASITNGRTSSAAFAIDNYGYVGTGNTNFGSTNDFQRYDPVADSWQMMNNVGPTNRQEASGFAVGGRGYILTGDNYSSGTNYKDVWEFDPTTGNWVQLADFAGNARRYLSATTLGSYAYVGLGTNGTNFKDFWRFDQTVSLIERNIDDLNILAFPNPTTEFVQFNIEWNKNVPTNEMSLIITSITGQVVYETSLAELDMINTSSWDSGSYIYSIIYHKKIVKSGTLIVN